MQQLSAGATLQGGKYIIEKVLGQGGFGITYLATHSFLEKRVAIKEFFPKDFCERDGNTSHITLGNANTSELVAKLKEKFLKEAKNISKLNHPNIVAIHDIFEENGTAYYLMDFIDGVSLNDKIKSNGPLTEKEALEYIHAAGSAIAYMHTKSMNHLDIKPANIMLRESDATPILIDFGLAKQYDSTGEQTSTTPVGISHGYAPVEQYRPGGVSTFTPQTDVYALGATLYALLSGVTPPHYSDILEDGLPELPATISQQTVEAIEKAMETKKAKRPSSIYDFLALLTASTTENKVKDANTPLSVKTSKIEQPKSTNIKEETPNIALFKEDESNEATSIIQPEVVSAILREKPVIKLFKVQNQGPVHVGEKISVYWNVQNANLIYVNGELVLPGSWKHQIKLTKQGENLIKLKASNSIGSTEKSIKIYAEGNILPPEIELFRIINEPPFYVGDRITLEWCVKNVQSVKINDQTFSSKGKTYYDLNGNGEAIFKLSAENNISTTTDQVSIHINNLKKGNLFIKPQISHNDPNYEIKSSARELEDELLGFGGIFFFVLALITTGLIMYIEILLNLNILIVIFSFLPGFYLSVVILMGIFYKIAKKRWIRKNPDDPRNEYLK